MMNVEQLKRQTEQLEYPVLQLLRLFYDAASQYQTGASTLKQNAKL